MPWYLGNSRGVYNWGGWGWSGVILPLAVWSLVWTGLALWHAAKRGEKGWFIFLLLVHTVGIIELIYLIFIARIFSPNKSSRRRK